MANCAGGPQKWGFRNVLSTGTIFDISKECSVGEKKSNALRRKICLKRKSRHLTLNLVCLIL